MEINSYITLSEKKKKKKRKVKLLNCSGIFSKVTNMYYLGTNMYNSIANIHI